MKNQCDIQQQTTPPPYYRLIIWEREIHAECGGIGQVCWRQSFHLTSDSREIVQHMKKI